MPPEQIQLNIFKTGTNNINQKQTRYIAEMGGGRRTNPIFSINNRINYGEIIHNLQSNSNNKFYFNNSILLVAEWSPASMV